MTEIEQTDWLLLRNLEDAGFDNKLKEKYLNLPANVDNHEQIVLLAKHRRALLNTIHDYQKKLDCLDYLINTIKKTTKKESKHK